MPSTFWCLPNADSLSSSVQPATVAAPSPFFAVVDDQSCPAVPPTLPKSWSCLTKSGQEFSLQHVNHLLTALRYYLRSPFRAGFAEDAMNWSWSPLCKHLSDPLLIETPPTDFSGSTSLSSIMNSRRSGPASIGNNSWERKTGEPPSRPRKLPEK